MDFKLLLPGWHQMVVWLLMLLCTFIFVSYLVKNNDLLVFKLKAVWVWITQAHMLMCQSLSRQWALDLVSVPVLSCFGQGHVVYFSARTESKVENTHVACVTMVCFLFIMCATVCWYPWRIKLWQVLWMSRNKIHCEQKIVMQCFKQAAE